MTLARFKYLAPSTLDEALGLLSDKREKAKIIAGGSDLVVQLKHRTENPEFLIDVKGLDGLRGIASEGENGTVIGSLTTLDTISRSQQIREQFPILAMAAGKVASVQIRNVGTLGGNVCLNTRCWYYNQSAQWRNSIPRCFKMGGDQCLVMKNSDKCHAVFLADTVPALMALEARLRIVGKDGERTIPVEKFYDGSGHPPNLLGSDEILTQILLPETESHSFTIFLKDAPRQVVDFALANMAVQITYKERDGACDDAKIAIGGVTSVPVRSVTGEGALKDQKITERLMGEVAELAVKDCGPISPIWISPNARRQTIKAFIKRALEGALAYSREI
jgi:4-hydroxybenzoyl-CoA reductase subunit beta